MRTTIPARLAILATLFLQLLVSHAADLQPLPGKVVRVVDGDTLVIEPADGRRRVRLAGIDSPERDQPWGEASTRKLPRQVSGKAVVVDWYKHDRWGRLIGLVRLDDEDMNPHMVDRGLPWLYKRYQSEQTPERREAYGTAETVAEGAKRGLWSGPGRVAPWYWRMR